MAGDVVKSMAAATAYAYLGNSRLDLGSELLALQTSGGPQPHPHFFAGCMTAPAATASGLLVLAGVALTRFDERRASMAMRDPVVTAGDERLRFEAFSACNGVYARLDLLPAGLDGQILGYGTTNVDINPPLRTALTRVRGLEPMHLAVGPEELAVTTFDGSLVERKVPLPARWLRGFTEAQVISSGFDLRAQLDRAGAVSFLNQLPRAGGKVDRSTVWAVPAGRSLRLSSRPTPGAVCLGGPARLGVLLPFLRHATGLRVYGPALTASSPATAGSWELSTPSMRLSVTLSPDVTRGFSGEGAALDQMVSEESVADADLISALLAWDTAIDVHALPAAAGLSAERVRAALSVLATAGRVGYDAAEAGYFHRALPYPVAAEELNPRLRRARALVAAGAVRLTSDTGTPGDTAIVSEQYHLRHGENVITCTCTWWQEYRGGRGPCAHALAFRIARAAAAGEALREDSEGSEDEVAQS